MEEKFIAAWIAARKETAALGIRLHPINMHNAMRLAHQSLHSGRMSEGFVALMMRGRLDLSLEALVLRKEFGALFSDDEANVALNHLLEGGYHF